MKQLIIAGAVAATLLAATGCGGSDLAPGPASYLAVSGSKVAFIQWHRASDGHLDGMMTEDSVGGSGPAQTLSVTTAPFTGTVTGKSVKLTFAALYFLHAHAHGTLDGNVLTMAVPQSDGTVRKVKFSQSGKGGYDHAIAALRTKVRRATVVAAKQQASRRGQPSHARAEQSTQTSLNALYKESSLALGSKLSNSVARLADAVKTAQSRLAKEKQDALGDNKYCAAALTVAGDAQGVDGTLQGAQGAVLSLMPGITAVRHDVATTTAALRHLSKSGLPAPSQAANVIANANASVRQAIVTANSYIAQANAIDARARTLAGSMATKACSGARSGASPHPIPPIGRVGGRQR